MVPVLLEILGHRILCLLLSSLTGQPCLYHGVLGCLTDGVDAGAILSQG